MSRQRSSGAGVEAFVAAQVARFRDRAELLAQYGAAEAAGSLQRAADDLEAAFRLWWLESLTVTQAAAESGYTEERLRELAPKGREGGRIRLRRCDLPRKAAPVTTKRLDAVAARLGIT